MSNKDIPDEAETKRVQAIIADAVTDHIVDANKKVEALEEQAAKNQPAIDLLTEWLERPSTEEEREAWEAFEKLVEESEPDETPEEAAERWTAEYTKDCHCYVPNYSRLKRAADSGFLAGVRWAEERKNK